MVKIIIVYVFLLLYFLTAYIDVLVKNILLIGIKFSWRGLIKVRYIKNLLIYRFMFMTHSINPLQEN